MIPHYHAKEATEAIKKNFPELYLYDPTPIWKVKTRETLGEASTFVRMTILHACGSYDYAYTGTVSVQRRPYEPHSTHSYYTL
eukprot:7830199-Pyramimonas_sp.AAC.1